MIESNAVSCLETKGEGFHPLLFCPASMRNHASCGACPARPVPRCLPLPVVPSAVSACFAATAVTPFEALRIKTVTVPGFPKTLAGAVSETISTGRLGDLLSGEQDETKRMASIGTRAGG